VFSQNESKPQIVTAAPRIISTVASEATAEVTNRDPEFFLKKQASDFDVNVSSKTSYIKRAKYTAPEEFLVENSECSSVFFKPLGDEIEDPGQLELHDPVMY